MKPLLAAGDSLGWRALAATLAVCLLSACGSSAPGSTVSPTVRQPLRSIDADAKAGHRLESEVARLEQAIKRPHARVDAALLDSGDRFLGDSGLRGQLSLGHPRAPARVPDHPPRHGHRRGS